MGPAVGFGDDNALMEHRIPYLPLSLKLLWPYVIRISPEYFKGRDAISINQKDDTEKALQIPLMTAIYQSADHVLAWLGKEADDSEFLMECVRDRSGEFLSFRFQAAGWEMLRRRWLMRTWIIQELVVNQNAPQVLCGSGPAISLEAILPTPRLLNAGVLVEPHHGRMASIPMMNSERNLLRVRICFPKCKARFVT